MNNRPLQKLASDSNCAKTRSAEPQCTLVHEDSSTDSTKQFGAEVEFPKRSNKITIFFASLIFCINTNALAGTRYGETLCDKPGYYCMKIKPNDTWEKLFPDPQHRDIVKRVNRMNVRIYTGMTIAVPQNLNEISIYDVSPFPRYVQSTGERVIYVNQKELAWGAYNEEGELVWWGPISTGSGHCRSLDGKCLTPPGAFRVINKQDIDCISTIFPIRPNGVNGGAIMPYCMHYYRGYALHGSNSVPGYRASHGCVRMFIEDARWLNEEFITIPDEYGFKGTRVIVNAV